MKNLNEKMLHTDVLIIGAGGAGLRAAIAAKVAGVEVLVVSKGPFPEGCNTAAAGGAMLVPLGKEDSPEKYLADTMRAGGMINYYGLVKVMAEYAGERALDLERYGAKYLRKGGEICLWPSSDNSLPRVLPAGNPYSGDWFKALVDEVKRLEITLYDRFPVVDLLRSGVAVVGAVGLEMATESVVTIYAKSVVLATGGAGSIYTFTSNHQGITGDGLVLAYKVGAALSHLEFVQMRQCIIHPEGLKGMLPPFDGFVSSGGRFYNGLHERYMRRYHPEQLEGVTRAEIAKCAQLEINAGRQSRHGGVYGDLSDVPASSLRRVKKFMSACRDIHFDPSYQCLEWAPASHHTMGGVVINASCQTGVLGLFAAGEVAAGVQGANRMGGNALTETQVFGAIAGAEAAARAQSIDPPVPDPLCTTEVMARIAHLLTVKNGADYQEVRARIAGIMSADVGVIRQEDGLRRAQRLLADIEASESNNLFLGWTKSFERLTELFEVRNMLTLCRLVVQAALVRTESRGAHQRQDFPETDPAWETHTLFRMSMVGPEIRLVPAGNSGL